MDDVKNPSASESPKEQNQNPAVESSDKKTKQTIPTLYPDIEFVNRTLP